VKFRSLCAVLLLAVSLAACGSSTPDHGTGKGTVAAVDAVKGEITLDHGDIPGIMGAMTMTYSVPDKKILAGVTPGAKVEFDMQVVKGDYRVTAIRPR
jgi:Cu(I)/Ag(I) efflux system protein CusF